MLEFFFALSFCENAQKKPDLDVDFNKGKSAYAFAAYAALAISNYFNRLHLSGVRNMVYKYFDIEGCDDLQSQSITPR